MEKGITIPTTLLIGIMESVVTSFNSSAKTNQDVKTCQAMIKPSFELLAEADIAGGYEDLTEAVEYCALELDLSDDDLVHATLAHIRQQSSAGRASVAA